MKVAVPGGGYLGETASKSKRVRVASKCANLLGRCVPSSLLVNAASLHGRPLLSAGGDDCVGAGFGAQAEVELVKGVGSLAADQQRLLDLGQGSPRRMGATGCAVSNEEVRTHSAGDPPSSSWTAPW